MRRTPVPNFSIRPVLYMVSAKTGFLSREYLPSRYASSVMPATRPPGETTSMPSSPRETLTDADMSQVRCASAFATASRNAFSGIRSTTVLVVPLMASYLQYLSKKVMAASN